MSRSAGERRLGLGPVVLAGVSIGAWASVAAGAVVTRSLPDFGLMVDSPARRAGWVSPVGVPLQPLGSWWCCPVEDRRFVEDGEVLEERP